MNRFIFHVDDSRHERELMEIAFTEVSSEVVYRGFDSGIACLMTIAPGADGSPVDVPDLFLIDVNMPLMNGPEVVRALRLIFPLDAIPIVMYSTSVNAHDRRRCLSAGATAYFEKSLSYAGTIDVATQILAAIEKIHRDAGLQ